MRDGFTTLRDMGGDWIKTTNTGAADGCRQAIRAGARSLEHAYLIDADALAMAKEAGTYVVPTIPGTCK